VIGYYVHHHGSGHAQRFAQLADVLPDLVGLGSGPPPAGIAADRWVRLVPDTDPARSPQDPTAGGALHWAPLREPRMTARTIQLADWVIEHGPACLVVDVSVEITLAARLLSVPTVVIAQHGVRDDLPHELAYRSASAVAALWPAGAVDDHRAAIGRVHHVGPLSRFDARAVPDAPRQESERRRALLLLGRGGHDVRSEEVQRAIQATRGHWNWEVVGAFPELGGRSLDGDACWDALGRAHVVVAAASNNCVAEVAAARRPLISIPQPRPFDEQVAHAESLERLGLATVLRAWPPAEQWPELLSDAAARGERWATYHDGGGVQRLAAVVTEVAGS
jgi:hypothetical protein